jgi:DNA repair exonuclease SbcCD ATPase subunit
MNFLVRKDDGKIGIYKMPDNSIETYDLISQQSSSIERLNELVTQLQIDMNSSENRYQNITNMIVKMQETLDMMNDYLEDHRDQGELIESMRVSLNEVIELVHDIKKEMSDVDGPYKIPGSPDIISRNNIVEVIADMRKELSSMHKMMVNVIGSVKTINDIEKELNGLSQSMHDLKSWVMTYTNNLQKEVEETKKKLTPVNTKILKRNTSFKTDETMMNQLMASYQESPKSPLDPRQQSHQ